MLNNLRGKCKHFAICIFYTLKTDNLQIFINIYKSLLTVYFTGCCIFIVTYYTYIIEKYSLSH